MPNEELLAKLQPADVILTSHLGFNVIKIGNFCKNGYHRRVWTHAALYIGNGEVIEAFPKGITRRKLKDAYLADRKSGLKILRRKNLSQDIAGRIVNFCTQTPGKPYDLRALIYFPLANLLPPSLSFVLTPGYLGSWFNQPDSYFCSELLSEAFEQADAYCFEREPFQVMPVDFDNTLLFEAIAVVHIPGQERQGKTRAFLLQLCYIVAAVIVFLIFLGLVALAIFFAVIMFKRFWPAKPVKEEPEVQPQPQPQPGPGT